jgi:dnd system-associated protein 4
VKDLVSQGAEPDGVFGSNADALAFAAALGAKVGRRRSFDEQSQDHAPIRLRVFENRGYGPLVNVLALDQDQNPEILASTDDQEDKRSVIFEEYAERGLAWLKEKMTGETDYARGLHSFLLEFRSDGENEEGGHDGVTELLQG